MNKGILAVVLFWVIVIFMGTMVALYPKVTAIVLLSIAGVSIVTAVSATLYCSFKD